ncbi:sugar ABC transporter [Rhizobium sp. Leaf384]|uniref:ABC transporter ATP-binding protein n=1 Tax=unclassified Rhizobium TaxID=2613769 RepID=UPI000715105F|nr:MULTISPECIES: ABC transporter ATP-binding protein [unclassified Rhizobium]KQR67935.1 sugar ABC transporter [Rhizobium sp. Leaf341]KQS74455.1 sugar ABC transporter [Rhizobium sp. Leaf383]KQS80193.1 sugar ABC transporter [Rhizobium sp. Leaf384]
MSLLSITSVSKTYGSSARALIDVSLTVPAGARTAIVGPSGSGKTTLLKLIAGFERPDAGRITLDGTDLAGEGIHVPAHKRGIGIVSQDGALFPHLTVGENIGFGLPRRQEGRDQRIAALMNMVELDADMGSRRPHQLSGGQQQRVALARALALEPRLMLLDEPFSALDTGLRDTMRRTVARILAASGTTSILVTHDQGEALSFADHVAVFREGRLVQAGSPQSLYRRPADRQTALFLGDAVLLDAVVTSGQAETVLGTIPVSTTDDASDRGGSTAHKLVMLRPEQLRIRWLGLGEADLVKGARARVLESEFGGGLCRLTVEVGEGPSRAVLDLRVSGFDVAAPGETVAIEVVGQGHVLPG